MTDRRRNVLAWIALLVSIAIISVIDWPANFWAGDPTIWREEARSILDHHSLAVHPAVTSIAGEPGQALVTNPRNGLQYSKYGLMNAIMSLPPMWLDEVFHKPARPLTDPNLAIMNAWNTLLALLTAAMFMRISSLYTDRIATRLIFVFTAFYATFLWYYTRAQSSEIYQLLFFTSIYFLLVMFFRDRKIWRLHLVWPLVAALVLTRVLYLLLIPLVIGFVVMWAMKRDLLRRIWPHLFFPPIAIVALLGWINFVKFGSPFLTGYHAWRPEDHLPTAPMIDGLWGMLFMPRFNIFLYFPPLIFACFAMREFYRRFRMDALVAIVTCGVFMLALSKIPTWAGEWTYGPRYLIFILPIVSLPFILFIDRAIDGHRPALTAVAGIALLYSTYLTFRVNSVDFFLFYDVKQRVEPAWNDEVAGYFRDHHVGTVVDELIRHRDDLDSLMWFSQMKAIWSEQNTRLQREKIRATISAGNYYWWSKRGP